MIELLNLYLHLKTRTWALVAVTWDLKVSLPQPIIRSPVSP